MKINPELVKILKNNQLNISDVITYLLSLYYGYEPTYIPDGLKVKIHPLGIVKFNSKNSIYEWNIPLFENQVTGLDWVKEEYLAIFSPFDKHNKFKRECVTRMQVLLMEHPQLHKELILEATQLYVDTCLKEGRQSKYVSQPHYFIEKGKGKDKVNAILTYVDLVLEEKLKNSGRNSPSIRMT